jgi:signal transduction histidine kinase
VFDPTLPNLSLRYKLPLQASALVLITALLLTSAILVREYQQSRQDLFNSAESTARLLATTLVQPLIHDDLWRVYALIHAPFDPADPWPLGADSLLVLDNDQRVYVASEPRRFPIGASLADVDAPFASLPGRLDGILEAGFQALAPADSEHFLFVVPIHFDGVALGSLALSYPRALVLPRFRSIVTRALFATGVVLLLMLPLTWWLGRRVAQPLVHLSGCMNQLGDRLPSEDACTLPDSRDEIGQLGRSFRQLLSQLRDKAALEQGMLASERLAAVGRITAGIAHEINNPLGGMLNAISTHRRHGEADALTARTLSLLDRGLKQIRDTVGALLVEARLSQHALTPQDLQDIQTLVGPDAQKRSVQVEWHSAVGTKLNLPSSPVRQILLNLVLNAIQASEPGGSVRCDVRLSGRFFQIAVTNHGRPIAREQMQHLFEPFVSGSGQGSGLGLWVTYQLVSQLEGRIEVTSGDDGETRFDVYLPVLGEGHL